MDVFIMSFLTQITISSKAIVMKIYWAFCKLFHFKMFWIIAGHVKKMLSLIEYGI